MATVADLVIRELLGAGVRALFGVPGGAGNLDLIDAAGRAGLPFVLTSTETGAALAAVAQAEITGAPGACLTTLGPGAASAVNGVACAYLDRAPVIVFTDSQSAVGGVAFEHQRLDHAALFAPIVKSSVTLTVEGAAQTVALGLYAAAADRPGPVHIDCPGGVASAAAPQKSPATVVAATHLAAPAWEQIDALVARAHKPLVIAGLGARRPEDAAATRAFCERRHVPAMVTYKGKGIVPDAHPWFAGVFTNASVEQAVVSQSDLILGVGLDPVELLPREWPYASPIVNVGRWAISSEHVPLAASVVGDLPVSLARIESRLAVSKWDAAALQRAVEAQRRAVRIPGSSLTAQQVVEIAASAYADGSRVTVDAGAHMLPATALWPVSEPGQMLISNGLSTMGFALPAAIGAALLDRDRPVVALTGDGGLLMCLGELATAVRERLRIIVVVFNDASLSLIEIKQQARRLPPAGVAIGSIDWTAVAAGFGVRSFKADTAAGVEHAVAQARMSDGPCLIEARIDRTNYGSTLQAIRG